MIVWLFIKKKRAGSRERITVYGSLSKLAKSEPVFIHDKQVSYKTLWLHLKQNKGVINDENYFIKKFNVKRAKRNG